jgi:hypothetical protein
MRLTKAPANVGVKNGHPKNTPATDSPLLDFSSEMLMNVMVNVMDDLSVQEIACMARSCEILTSIVNTNALGRPECNAARLMGNCDMVLEQAVCSAVGWLLTVLIML